MTEPKRTTELTLTVVVPRMEDDATADLRLQTALDELGFPWFAVKTANKEGRRTTLAVSFKRPRGI